MNTKNGRKVTRSEAKIADLWSQWHYHIEKREKFAHKVKNNEIKWALHADSAARLIIQIEKLK